MLNSTCKCIFSMLTMFLYLVFATVIISCGDSTASFPDDIDTVSAENSILGRWVLLCQNRGTATLIFEVGFYVVENQSYLDDECTEIDVESTVYATYFIGETVKSARGLDVVSLDVYFSDITPLEKHSYVFRVEGNRLIFGYDSIGVLPLLDYEQVIVRE